MICSPTYFGRVNELGDYIRHLRGLREITLQELASKLGYTHSMLSKKERGEGRFSQRELDVLSAEFGISTDDLLRGAKEHRVAVTDTIPVVNMASAGVVWSEIENQEFDGENGVERVERGGIKHPKAFGIRVTGDSMHPTVFSGDVLMCEPLEFEEEIPRLVSGRMVVVALRDDRFGDSLQVGRWFWKNARSFRLSKDNPKYPQQDFELDRDRVARLAVVVQVRRDNP